MRYKYKIGEKVKVREDLELCRKYGMENSNVKAKVLSHMIERKGKIVTISKIRDKKYCIEEGHSYSGEWTDAMFEPVSRMKIVITTDGDETLAELYEGKRLVDTSSIVCCPKNNYRFLDDAMLALTRLAKLDITRQGKCIHETDVKNENKMQKIINLLQEANAMIDDLNK